MASPGRQPPRALPGDRSRASGCLAGCGPSRAGRLYSLPRTQKQEDPPKEAGIGLRSRCWALGTPAPGLPALPSLDHPSPAKLCSETTGPLRPSPVTCQSPKSFFCFVT